MTKFFEDAYIPPSIRLKLMLRSNKVKLNPKSPDITGYVTVNSGHIEQLRQLVENDPHHVVHLRVAIWGDGNNNENYPIQGSIDYRIHTDSPEDKVQLPPQEKSIWY